MSIDEQNPMSSRKLLQYLNEILSVENATFDRLNSRINETQIPEVKNQMQRHLTETSEQRERLINLIKNRGGTPTLMKANLPFLIVRTENTSRIDEMISTSNTSQKNIDKIKSIVSDIDNRGIAAEKELMKCKEDIIIENAEVVSYRMLMEIAKKIGAQDAVIVLRDSLNEEEFMVEWLVTNSSKLLNSIWPYIESTAGNRTIDA